MTEADLEAQLEALDGLLDEVTGLVDAFEQRLEKVANGIEKLEEGLPKLDAVLTVAENAQVPDPQAYHEVAEGLFASLSQRLQTAEAVLDISFDPAEALEGLTDKVKETLGEITEFVGEAADNFEAVMDGFDTLVSETVVEGFQSAVSEWQSMSEEAEEQVTSASATFEDARSLSTEQLEVEIKERLEDAMGEHVTKISQDIDAVFDSAEKVLDQADGLVSKGVGEVTDAANKVLVIQKGINDIRPLLEILM